eukprot:TRINITY_DN5634_c0_g1_i3.p1 TRINITY_DN5634_c0_g1~~TRINITY_DN5634_c0_g1_i3.p1  ORF type:complete len:248 (-),score=33.51 TRINITY_DN5634_c0_g1_i3:107-850(-)
MSWSPRRQQVAASFLVAACAAFLACAPSFVQLVPTAGPSPGLLAASRHAAGLAAASDVEGPAGRSVLFASLLGAAACIRLAQRGRSANGILTGSGNAHSVASNLLIAQLGDADDSQSPVVMGGIIHRPHVRICERTHKDWLRGRRRNSAARQRFLIRWRDDGSVHSVWRRQAGLRHLKSKKNPKRLKRMKRMLRIRPCEYKRVNLLLNIKLKGPRASDYIMRKFNAARSKDHLGMSDNGTGNRIWVS